MKKFTALLLMVGLLSFLGCHNWPQVRNNNNKPSNWNPKAEDLVEYLNSNAKRVQAIQCNSVIGDARQGLIGGIGFDGVMVFEKPHNLRFKAKVAGIPGVDIGSNSDEFWFWVSKMEPPHVYHCAYADLAKGNVPMPFPFQPDFLIAAMGVQEYNPQGKYDVKVNRDTVELIEATTSPAGQPLQKIVVFNRGEVAPPQPQVQALILRDANGKDVFVVRYQEMQLSGPNAILPLRMTISLPQDKDRSELVLKMRDMKVVNLPPEQSASLFSRAELMRNRQGWDLARQRPDSATGTSGLRPVGGIEIAPR
jgi:hypothetical protein